MFSKLEEIRGLPPYDQFKWANLDPFCKINVIYGWNYSGKTTLSRLFQHYESEKYRISQHQADFSLRTTDGTLIRKQDIDKAPPIRVFNDAYIKSNLDWDSLDAQSFVVIGEVDIASQKQIDELNLQLVKLEEGIAEGLAGHRKLEQSLNEKMTNDARAIRNKLRYSHAYSRTHLQNRLSTSTGEDIKGWIIDDDEVVDSKVSQFISSERLLRKLPRHGHIH